MTLLIPVVSSATTDVPVLKKKPNIAKMVKEKPDKFPKMQEAKLKKMSKGK